VSHSTRDEALLWLNDHLGRVVSLGVGAGLGAEVVPFLIARGTLEHLGRNMRDRAQRDRSGLYKIGDCCTLDLTRFHDACLHGDSKGLFVRLANNVGMTIRATENGDV
jgi:hypothetical protein